MKYRTETHTTPDGARVETGIVVHEGREFAALGSVVDPARGIIVGYVSDARPDVSSGNPTRFVLTTWQGEAIAPLMLVRRWTSYGVARCTLFAWTCVLGGKRYSGRNSGPGMVVRMRARVTP